MHTLDLNAWHRKQHFEFFNDFEQPFFNLCATVDVTQVVNYCQQNQRSFFICSLFLLGYTANQIPEFNYRIKQNNVQVHDQCSLSCTVLNPDQSFSFCDFGNCTDFARFYQHAQQQLARSKQGLLPFNSQTEQSNCIYCSVLPWLHFTSFSHAQKRQQGDSTPRIVMGKYKKNANEIAMPVSVEVHHALVDGLHVGQYFAKLQENFDHYFN
ncbi:CatA-like O-acetyltransferase [Paraglaciecola aestuariivivens]